MGTTASRAQGPSNSGKCEKACCPSGLLLLLFLFLLPWYPWRSHERRACSRTDCSGLAAPGCTSGHRGRPRNSPHAEEFCSVSGGLQTSEWCFFVRRLRLLFSPSAAAAAAAACVCCLYACESRRSGVCGGGNRDEEGVVLLLCTVTDTTPLFLSLFQGHFARCYTYILHRHRR